MNVSIRYPDVPVLHRAQRARDDGFTVIESWWPFDRADPPAREVERFVASVQDAGVQLVALNTFAGDLAAGERGIAADPARAAEFADAVDGALALGARLGTRMFNTLVGRGDDAVAQALPRLAPAAETAARHGARLLVEPLSGVPDYPVTTTAAAFDLVARLGPGAGVLADLYHLAVNGEDVDAAIAARGAEFTHVQIADAPGRGAPGTGSLPLARWLRSLRAVGYDGWIVLEHLPDDDERSAAPSDRDAG